MQMLAIVLRTDMSWLLTAWTVSSPPKPSMKPLGNSSNHFGQKQSNNLVTSWMTIILYSLPKCDILVIFFTTTRISFKEDLNDILSSKFRFCIKSKTGVRNSLIASFLPIAHFLMIFFHKRINWQHRTTLHDFCLIRWLEIWCWTLSRSKRQDWHILPHWWLITVKQASHWPSLTG